jgi:mannan endo-1,4-beta-mannosidase
MAWELANEPRCDSDKSGNTLTQWAEEMSDYVKSIDQNHLLGVGDGGFLNRPNATSYGYNGYNGVDWERLIQLPSIDYATFHLYPESWGKDWSDTLQSGLEWIKIHCDLAEESNIPVVLEEYGVSSRSVIDRNMIYDCWNEACYESDADGSMFWILTGIDTIQERADKDGLYPDSSGFRIVEGSDTATFISEYAQLMAGRLNETDLPPRIYFVRPYEDEEITGAYQITTTVIPRGREVHKVAFAASQLNQNITLESTFITDLMKYTYAGVWNTSVEQSNKAVEGVATVEFSDSSSASTSVQVKITNGPAQYVVGEQFSFDHDLEGFRNAGTYQAEYGVPPIQHSDFHGGSLQANIKWFGDYDWSEIRVAKKVSNISDYVEITYEMYVPKSQLTDTDGMFKPFFALNWEKINLGSSDVGVSNAEVVEIDGKEFYRVAVGSEYEKRLWKTELELGLVGMYLDYEGPVYIDNVTLIKKVYPIGS